MSISELISISTQTAIAESFITACIADISIPKTMSLSLLICGMDMIMIFVGWKREVPNVRL